ncbi:hypothetical protein B296_00044115 [Ensete ventricosum]|uniref:Uncharacterized protein n=1 Tax=Ensete ventricosum TaxID=4639 RepID=A0A426Y7S7_ENSVE|nr:hypothetical protein B296_00044115 [Ensete ventricosum]
MLSTPCRLLTEDPHQRLGANGASEVCQATCVFQRYQLGHTCKAEGDVNCNHTIFCIICLKLTVLLLPILQAAFVPSSDNAFDTSYFTSRFSWNPSDEQIYEASEFEDSSDNGSISGNSSCLSNPHDELVCECDCCFIFFLTGDFVHENNGFVIFVH